VVINKTPFTASEPYSAAAEAPIRVCLKIFFQFLAKIISIKAI
jgi:hypothetical protein